MFVLPPTIAVVTQPTRLHGLVERWATRSAAKFHVKQAVVQEHALRPPASRRRDGRAVPANAALAEGIVAGEAAFAEYEQEDFAQRRSLDELKTELDLGYPLKFVERRYLPTFDFRGCVAAVVVGQDGLVANTAKYVGDVPIVAVNPDPSRIDGILLPFHVRQARQAVVRTLENRAKVRQVTLAKVTLNDGQSMLAFNDFFVGCRSHVSARYVLRVENRAEPQSSSGMIVSTGAGSTGWLSSVCNMAGGFAAWIGEAEQQSPSAMIVPAGAGSAGWLSTVCDTVDGVAAPIGERAERHVKMTWEDRRLVWVVREPFRSKLSGSDLVAGFLEQDQELVIESLMPSNGVIFSDGIEADYLEFTSGAIARISVAPQCARLVVS
ncbi:MAG: NAD+ kinase [Planctomycetia bacterium]|nr:NAD+ kinase [Planctomycetia bacterium]